MSSGAFRKVFKPESNWRSAHGSTRPSTDSNWPMTTTANSVRRVLQFCTYDGGGGAEHAASTIHQALTTRQIDSQLMVRRRLTNVADVVEADAYAGTSSAGSLFKLIDRAITYVDYPGRWRVQDWLRCVAYPARLSNRLNGIEDFDYPYTAEVAGS